MFKVVGLEKVIPSCSVEICTHMQMSTYLYGFLESKII